MHYFTLKHALIASILCASFSLLTAQISFTDQSSLLSNTDFHSGVAIGVTDLNNDGLDDIIRLNGTSFLQVELQGEPGEMFTTQAVGNTGGGQWMVVVGDMNNDGFNDIVTGGAYNEIKSYTYNTGTGEYDFAEMPGASLFAQGANMVDINNDGWLDVFVCHDDAESRIWSNNGDGTFAEADDWIDMSTTPASDDSGNYGSVWTDFDNDGDLDLYIAKCRQGVNDPTDPRRINQLFVNDGSNNFSEAAEEFGLKIGAQSWTADFGDYDNDGDMDCFITNHDAPSQVLENDGTGHFTDVTETAGVVVGGLPIQGVWRDFDNDGFVDIVVSGTSEYLFHNNGDGTFTELADPFPGSTDMESYAIGDLNNDGFLDIYGGYANVFNSPTNIEDVLWMNEGNDNNWICIDPIGVISNQAAVGARIEIFGNFGMQVREIRAGESYGISNSLKAHFGIGSHESIETVVVKFPSGIIKVIENPEINQTVQIIEEGCLISGVTVQYEGNAVVCPGESLTLTAPEAASYVWSNGEETQSIEVTEGGNYSVFITDEDGCIGSSTAVNVLYNPDATPSIEVEATGVCEGETITLTASSSEAGNYTWSTNETSQSIVVSEPGEYFVSVAGTCQDFVSETVGTDFEFYIPELPEGVNDTIYEPGNAILFAPGDNISWYDTPSGGSPVGTGAFFETPYITATTPYYIEDLQNFAGAEYSVGMPEHSGNSLYGGDQWNGSLIFDALDAFVLRTVRVYTDTPGVRVIEVRDANENVLDFTEVNVPVGEHVLEVNLEVPAGTNLQLGTNTETNQANFGINNARFQRNNSNTNYPYVVEDIVTIKESIFGPEWYYYFYDWQIESAPTQCLSERAEVLAVLETSSIFSPSTAEALTLQPNPSTGAVFFELPRSQSESGTIRVFDLTGKEIIRQATDTSSLQRVDLEDFVPGIYLVKVEMAGRVFTGKVVKN